MPRLYGQAHLIDTDTPGLLLWVGDRPGILEGAARARCAAMAGRRRRPAGPGVHREDGRRDGPLPLLLWLIAGDGCPEPYATGKIGPPGSTASSRRARCWPRWAWRSSRSRCLQHSSLPQQYRPFRPPAGERLARSDPGDPAGRLVLRRLLGRSFPQNKVWGVERPALETLTAILAFAPVIGWLGNPAWWRETLPRLSHYYTLNTERESVLPKIQIIYFGQIYEFSLPGITRGS